MTSIPTIQAAVCRRYQIPQRMLSNPGASREYPLPRQVAIYLARKLTELSLTEIGSGFDRDRATVIYAIRNVERRSLADPAFSSAVTELLGELLAEEQELADDGAKVAG